MIATLKINVKPALCDKSIYFWKVRISYSSI